MLRARTGTAAENGKPGPQVSVSPPVDLPDAVLPRQLRKLGGRGGKGGALPALIQAEQVADMPGFATYREQSRELLKATAAEFSVLAGGSLGAAPHAFLIAGSLEFAAGRWLYDRAAALAPADGNTHTAEELNAVADIFAKAARLMGCGRQDMLAAWEVAMRSAGSGGEGGEVDAAEASAQAEARLAARRTVRVSTGGTMGADGVPYDVQREV